MKEKSIVPPASIINGRIIGEYVRIDKYDKYYWSCPIHGVTSSNPMRIKDMKARKGPKCCYIKNGESNPNWKGEGSGLGARKYNSIKNGAAARRKGAGGIVFDVTKEYLWNLFNRQDGICPYSGRNLGNINNREASLDRINSDKGYIEGNVEWVHVEVNLAKQKLKRSEFIILCQEVSKNFHLGVEYGQPFDDPTGEKIIWRTF